jgi:hypothetical protein
VPEMTPAEEDDLIARVERDAQDPDAWEEEPRSEPVERARLGAQLTVRLSPDTAERLSKAAAAAGMLYTRYARQLIEDGLRAAELSTATGSSDAATASFLIEVRVRPGDIVEVRPAVVR